MTVQFSMFPDITAAPAPAEQFNWSSDDSVVIPSHPAIAAYVNNRGDVIWHVAGRLPEARTRWRWIRRS
jgi:hypothetical protein